MPNEKTLPFDAFIYDFIEFCFEQNDSFRLVYQGGRSSEGSKIRAAFSNILHNESIYTTYEDISKPLGITSKDGVKRYLGKHDDNMKDKFYLKTFRELQSLVDMYRAKKSTQMKLGEPSVGYDRYGGDTVAKCSKTGRDILYGDFISGASQGGHQFYGIPLVEIAEGVLGVNNHLIKIPLFYDKQFDDVVVVERIKLEKKSPLEWRYAT